MNQSSRAKLTTKPIAPRALLAEMGITELDSMPIDDNNFHYLYGRR